MSEKSPPGPAGKSAKKPYRRPRLARFGAIKHVTAGGSGFLPEGGMGMGMGGFMNRMRFP